MINENLIRTKMIFSCVTATLNEGSVNKLQKCLKPTVTFATIPSQLTTIRCYFASGTKLSKIQLICFPAWFVKLVVMTRSEICCRSSITLLFDIRYTKKQNAHSTIVTSYKNLSFLLKLRGFDHHLLFDLR